MTYEIIVPYATENSSQSYNIWSGAMIRKSYRVLKTITTIDGTLYEGDMVHFQSEESNGKWKVKDTMGKIWYLQKEQVTDSPVTLSIKEKSND